MLKLGWKWIGYYIFSSLLIAGFCLAVFWLSLMYFNLDIPADASIMAFFIAAAGASLLGLASGFFFSKTLRSKLEEISVGVKALTYGDLNFRLPFVEDKDVGQVAAAFNELAERIDEQVTALQKLAEKNLELVQKTKTTAVAEERQRLARDLHDAVSQQLFAIALTSATAKRLIEKEPSRCGELIEDIERAATKAQTEMRALLLQLRPAILREQRLHDAIEQLVQELAAKTPIKCHLDVADITLPGHLENQLYRIFQEALSNVLRHSQATKVAIKLESLDQNQRAYLVIEDNGVGFDQTKIPQTSYGIQSIKERVSEFGGTVKWVSVPQKGTRLEVRIPIRNEV